MKKLVEEHAGIIEAENLPGGGAMIRIQFPIDEISRSQLIANLPGRVEQGRAKI